MSRHTLLALSIVAGLLILLTIWMNSAACARELAALEAPHGVYAVLGNHDVWTDADRVARELVEAGIVVLRNERRRSAVEDTRLWLLGIEDAGYTGYTGLTSSSFTDFRAMWQDVAQALAELLEGIPQEDPRLLLAHNPDFLENGERKVENGFPFSSSILHFPRSIFHLPYRGIGLIGLPVRFNCRPEVTLLRLKRAGEGASADS